MANVGQLYIELGADVARLRKDMGEATSIIKSFKSETESAFKGVQAAAMSYLSFQGLVQVFKSTVEAYAEEERGLLRLEAVLRAHGVTNKEVTRIYNEMAEELQVTTRYTDDQIRSAQELLTTMGVTPSKMREVIEASVALGIRTGDLNSAAQALGQAFEGNYKQLKRLIPQLQDVKKGQLDLDAVLKIVRDNYGDIAQREMDGYAGQVDKLKKEWAEFGKDVGGIVVPALTKALEILNSIGKNSGTVDFGMGMMGMPSMDNDPKDTKDQYGMALYNQQMSAASKMMVDQQTMLDATGAFKKTELNKQVKDTAMSFEELRDLWIKAEAEKYSAAEEFNDKYLADEKKRTDAYWKDYNDLQLKNAVYGFELTQENMVKSWELKARQIEELNALEMETYRNQEEAAQELFGKIMGMANSAGEYGEGVGLIAGNYKDFVSSFTGNDQWTTRIDAAQQYYDAVAEMAANNASYLAQLEEAGLNLSELKKTASFQRTANMYSSMLGMMSGAALAYYKSSGKQSEAAFTAYKALAIAQTVIATIAATQEAYKTGLQVTNSMGGGVAFAAIAAAVGAARVAQIATTDSGNAASSMSGVSAGGYTYTNPETPTWGKDKTESGRTVNIYVYGNVIDHQQFARDIVPYLDSAEADGVH